MAADRVGHRHVEHADARRGVLRFEIESSGLVVVAELEVARRRAVDLGVRGAIDAVAHGTPAIATRRTVRVSPGSKRTAVPAGMFRRIAKA